MFQQLAANVGLVAIGRNEGRRLAKCLSSIVALGIPAVYVDSGSTDDSVSQARLAGIDVIELDSRVPFTAARARNEGFRRLCQSQPGILYVQFVDADCEVVTGWIGEASAFLDAHSDVAVVYGRRRERYPTQSIYNKLCDIEWDTPIGEAKGCGGDALMRVDAFREVGGFRADVIAAEDTELCVRLRAARWRIWRLDAEMTVHDAAMTRFIQWWWRALRAGYCFAQGAHLHGAKPERHFVRESRRAWLWGIWLPIIALVAGLLVTPWSWVAFLVYPLQVLRLTIRNTGTPRQRAEVAIFQVLARFPEGLGQLKFLRDRLFEHHTAIIEYK